MNPLHPKTRTPEQWATLAVRVVLLSLLACLLSWPADWVVWRIRVAAGGGMDAVDVSHVAAAELKGNKEEYYLDGISSEPCSRSLFGWAGAGACWQLRRHPEVVTRY